MLNDLHTSEALSDVNLIARFCYSNGKSRLTNKFNDTGKFSEQESRISKEKKHCVEDMQKAIPATKRARPGTLQVDHAVFRGTSERQF